MKKLFSKGGGVYKLSIVIPCFNEASNLPILIKRCEDVFYKKSIEVILVDNGSTDNSHEILSTYNRKEYIKSIKVENNMGYGYGILYGLRHASGEYVGWTHADLQTDVADVLKALKIIEIEDFDTTLFIKGKRSGRPLKDRFFTFFMSVFETLLLRKLMTDINAQPTIFNRKFFELWESPPHDFSLDLYAYFLAKKNNLSFRKISVIFSNRIFGLSSWNINWKQKIKFITRTLRYSFELKKRMKDASI